MVESQKRNDFSFVDTQATKKIFGMKGRIRAVCGGTSASKTISIIIWIIDWLQSNLNKKFDVISESYPHLEDGAIKDFKAIMLDRGYWKDENWNGTQHTYKFGTSMLKFISIDKLGKAHGPRRDGLFINEANNIAYKIYDQLEVRTKEVIWLDWNPSTEFWYYTEIKDKVAHDFITLTYLDCIEALDQRIIDSIESKKERKGWWQVYGLGQLGEVEGRIYKDWKIIDDVPQEAKLVSRGLDFGFTNDPTVIEDIYYYNGGYIWDELLWRKGMHNDEIARFLKNLSQITTIADSAEPKSIEEISKHGVSIIGAQKGQGSVKRGIDFVQSQRISITRRSYNTIKAYRNYLWKVDKNGLVLNEPSHEFSDPMDAGRYGMSLLIPGNNEGKKSYNKAYESYIDS